jgi:hypothetical protein
MNASVSFRLRGAIVAVAIFGGAACDSNSTPNDAAAATDTTPQTDAVVDRTATDAPQPTDGAASTLYERLGRRAGIASAVDAIVARELMDPEIASYFYYQVTPGPGGMPPVAGHPSVAQLKSCLVNQLANVAGGPEAYPGTPADNLGWQCRNMADSHAGLRIPGTVFDRFVSIAAGVLTSAGVSAADVGTIGTVLNGTRPAIVDSSRDGGAFITPDASVDGGG